MTTTTAPAASSPTGASTSGPTGMSHYPLMNVNDVAEALAVGERYVRRLVFERRLPYLKIGAKVRFIREDVDAFVASSRREVGITLEPEDLFNILTGLDRREFLDRDPAGGPRSLDVTVSSGP